MLKYPGMPVPAESLRPPLWVAEIVYVPLVTELLDTARKQGCRTLDGGGMAVFQGARAFTCSSKSNLTYNACCDAFIRG
jgi:shikimate dehydrogenase